MVFTIEHPAVGTWEVVCYTLTNEEGALITDPDVEPRTLMRWLEDKKIIGIILIHCHGDYIGAVNELAEAYGCPAARGVDDVDGVADIHRPGFNEEGIGYTINHVDRPPAESDAITRGGDIL